MLSAKQGDEHSGLSAIKMGEFFFGRSCGSASRDDRFPKHESLTAQYLKGHFQR